MRTRFERAWQRPASSRAETSPSRNDGPGVVMPPCRRLLSSLCLPTRAQPERAVMSRALRSAPEALVLSRPSPWTHLYQTEWPRPWPCRPASGPGVRICTKRHCVGSRRVVSGRCAGRHASPGGPDGGARPTLGTGSGDHRILSRARGGSSGGGLLHLGFGGGGLLRLDAVGCILPRLEPRRGRGGILIGLSARGGCGRRGVVRLLRASGRRCSGPRDRGRRGAPNEVGAARTTGAGVGRATGAAAGADVVVVDCFSTESDHHVHDACSHVEFRHTTPIQFSPICIRYDWSPGKSPAVAGTDGGIRQRLIVLPFLNSTSAP